MLLYAKLFFSVYVKINVDFTVKQNRQKFGLIYSILKRIFKYGRNMLIFRDFRPSRPRRNRDFENDFPILRARENALKVLQKNASFA